MRLPNHAGIKLAASPGSVMWVHINILSSGTAGHLAVASWEVKGRHCRLAGRPVDL